MSYDSGRILNPIGGGSWLFANLPVGTAAATIPAGTQAYCSDLQTTCVYNGTSWVPFNNTSTNVSGLVAGLTSAAAANTALIQAALNNGGNVSINQVGTFYVTTLTYYSNTQLSLAANTILRQPPGNNNLMLQSGAAVAFLAGGTAVTLTYTSGLSVSVAWPNHGFTVGQCVWLTGSTPTAFNGVFRIITVTDANDFVINLRYVPASGPSGSAIGVAAVQNVMIQGGTWNYDYANNPSATARGTASLLFEGVADIVIRNVVSTNSWKYAFVSCASLNLLAESIVAPNSGGECFKVYGPAFDHQIRGITGNALDDGTTVQAKEASAFAEYQIALGGDAIGINAEKVDINCNNATGTYRIAGVYVSDNEVSDQIVFDDVQGNVVSGHATGIDIGNSFSTGQFGSISFRNVSASVSAAQYYQVYAGTCSGQLLNIERVRLNMGNLSAASASMVATSATATISKVNIFECDDYQPSYPGTTEFNFSFTGIHSQVSIDSCFNNTATASDNRLFILPSGSGCAMLIVRNCTINANTIGTISSGVTITPEIVISSCKMLGYAAISTSVNCNVAICGGTQYTNAANGVVRAAVTGLTINLKSDGTTTLSAGSWFTVATGTVTLNVYGFDITLSPNPSGTLQTGTGRGQYCTSTSSGTNMAGPAIYTTQNGWLAVGTGAAGVNTAITT